MKLSLVTAAAALLITTAAAHADAGRIPSDLQGAWCKVTGNADLYKSGHCPNDIHVTTTGYTSASHSHAPSQCALTASFKDEKAFLMDLDCTKGGKTSMWVHKHKDGKLHMWLSDVTAASKASKPVANAQ
jgi:hypothetical protein